MADLREMRLFAETYLPFFERVDGHALEIQEGFIPGLISFANPLDEGLAFMLEYGHDAFFRWPELQQILPDVDDPMFLCSGMLGHALFLTKGIPESALTDPEHRLWFRMALTRLREITENLYPQSLQPLSQPSRLTVTTVLPQEMDEPPVTQTLTLTADGNVRIENSGPDSDDDESFAVDALASEQLFASASMFLEHYTAEYTSGCGSWELKLEDAEGHFCAINGCLTVASDLYAGLSSLFRTLLHRDNLYLFDGNEDRLDTMGIQFRRTVSSGPETGRETVYHLYLSAKAETVSIQKYRNDTLQAEQTVRLGSCIRTLLDTVPQSAQGLELAALENAPVSHSMEVHMSLLGGSDISEHFSLEDYAISTDMMDFFTQLDALLPSPSVFSFTDFITEIMQTRRWQKNAKVYYQITRKKGAPVFVTGASDLCDPGERVIVHDEKTDTDEPGFVISLFVSSPYNLFFRNSLPRINKRYTILRRARPEDTVDSSEPV